MRKLLALGNRYAKTSDWTDFALTKLCLCALGVLIGVNIAPKSRKPAAAVALGLFAASDALLMARVARVAREMLLETEE